MTYVEYCQARATISYYSKEYQRRKKEEETKRKRETRLRDFKESLKAKKLEEAGVRNYDIRMDCNGRKL